MKLDRIEKGIIGILFGILVITTPVSFFGGFIIGEAIGYGFATLFSFVALFVGIAGSLIWFSWYVGRRGYE